MSQGQHKPCMLSHNYCNYMHKRLKLCRLKLETSIVTVPSDECETDDLKSMSERPPV